MWQAILTIALLIGAAAFAIRHFTRVTGNDCTCSGCSTAGCRNGKHGPEHGSTDIH